MSDLLLDVLPSEGLGGFSTSQTGVNLNFGSGGGFATPGRSILGAAPVLPLPRVGRANLTGTAQGDLLVGTNSADSLVGLDGNDTLQGLSGNDTLNGNTGNDFLQGNAGIDDLLGGQNADTLWGGQDGDRLNGNQGTDTLNGNDGNDTVNGGSENDLLNGGKGNDLLFGDLGDDTLWGDLGADALTGGSGRDRFVLAKGNGGSSLAAADILVDFRRGEDLIALNGLGFADVTIAPGTGANATDSVVTDRTSGEFLALIKNQTSLAASDFVSLFSPPPTPTPAPTPALSSVIEGSATIASSDTEAAIAAKNPPTVKAGTTSFYAGYAQLGDNQDPRLARYDGGRQVWFRSDYETTGDDSRGYGLLWDGGNNLYAVFSANGTQGTPAQDFRRFATNGWLPTYGQGGGPKVSILAKLNPADGSITHATFLTAQRSNGATNTLNVTGLSFNGQNVVVQADSFFSPRKPDKTPFTCTGASPFNYTIELTPDLKTAVRASAPTCS